MRKGVRQFRQKNSALSGAGSFRQPAHTGTQVKPSKGRSQIRHWSGKRSEKRPCETLPKIGEKKSGRAKARLLLEKTHLPGEFPFYNKARPLQASGAGMNLLRQVILNADLFHDVQLAFEIVDVMFFVEQDLFEQFARPIVAHRRGNLNGFV